MGYPGIYHTAAIRLKHFANTKTLEYPYIVVMHVRNAYVVPL